MNHEIQSKIDSWSTLDSTSISRFNKISNDESISLESGIDELHSNDNYDEESTWDTVCSSVLSRNHDDNKNIDKKRWVEKNHKKIFTSDNDLISDDEAFAEIAFKIVEKLEQKNLVGVDDLNEGIDLLIKKLMSSRGLRHDAFMEALAYRMSLLPIYPEIGENSLQILTRKAASVSHLPAIEPVDIGVGMDENWEKAQNEELARLQRDSQEKKIRENKQKQAKIRKQVKKEWRRLRKLHAGSEVSAVKSDCDNNEAGPKKSQLTQIAPSKNITESPSEIVPPNKLDIIIGEISKKDETSSVGYWPTEFIQSVFEQCFTPYEGLTFPCSESAHGIVESNTMIFQSKKTTNKPCEIAHSEAIKDRSKVNTNTGLILPINEVDSVHQFKECEIVNIEVTKNPDKVETCTKLTSLANTLDSDHRCGPDDLPIKDGVLHGKEIFQFRNEFKTFEDDKGLQTEIGKELFQFRNELKIFEDDKRLQREIKNEIISIGLAIEACNIPELIFAYRLHLRELQSDLKRWECNVHTKPLSNWPKSDVRCCNAIQNKEIVPSAQETSSHVALPLTPPHRPYDKRRKGVARIILNSCNMDKNKKTKNALSLHNVKSSGMEVPCGIALVKPRMNAPALDEVVTRQYTHNGAVDYDGVYLAR